MLPNLSAVILYHMCSLKTMSLVGCAFYMLASSQATWYIDTCNLEIYNCNLEMLNCNLEIYKSDFKIYTCNFEFYTCNL